MDALKSLVQPLVGGGGGSSMIDGMKLVVLGGTVETARRVASSGWYALFPFFSPPSPLTHPSLTRSHFINCTQSDSIPSHSDSSFLEFYHHSLLLDCPFF